MNAAKKHRYIGYLILLIAGASSGSAQVFAGIFVGMMFLFEGVESER